MNYEALLRDAGDRQVNAALVGAGQFGESLIGQAQRMARLNVPVVCDRDLDRVRAVMTATGIDASAYRECSSGGEARACIEAGRIAVLNDWSHVAGLPVDIVVEATGVPEVSARTAVAAIDAGHHVAMVTKETESVIGPWLFERARRAGRHYTPVDGDQPSLLLGLVSWARTLGLDVVCAGKSSEYDFVWDAQASAVHWRGQSFEVPDLAHLWKLGESPADTLAARAGAMAAIAQRTVPDLCEMLVVINHSDLHPSTPGLNVPIARPAELPELLRPRSDGGLLDAGGVVDVFNCYRRPDELSFAGGVFVVVRCEGAHTWSVLAGKGHPVSASGSHALLYNAQHLLGVEAPMTLLQTCLLDAPSGALAPAQRYDLVASAARDLRAGHVFMVEDAHHHELGGLSPSIEPAGPIGADGPVPYYMLEGLALKRDVSTGEGITADMIERPSGSFLWQCRDAMDAASG